MSAKRNPRSTNAMPFTIAAADKMEFQALPDARRLGDRKLWREQAEGLRLALTLAGGLLVMDRPALLATGVKIVHDEAAFSAWETMNECLTAGIKQARLLVELLEGAQARALIAMCHGVEREDARVAGEDAL